MTPAAVQRPGDLPSPSLHRNPGDAPPQEVRGDHGSEGPHLQVRALDRRVERDATATRVETLTEVDVFDGGIGVAKFVEPADGGELLRDRLDCQKD